jgi:hypothetical protein
MLGVINADVEHSIASQIELTRVRCEAVACCALGYCMLISVLRFAQQADYVLTPGQSLPSDVKTSMGSLIKSISTEPTTADSTTSHSAITPTASPSDRSPWRHP